jgi:hypothetical protein
LTLQTLQLPSSFSPAYDAECTAQEGNDQGTLPPCDNYEVTAANVGGAPTTGPVTLTDTLPAGLHVVSVYFFRAEEFTGVPPETKLYPEYHGEENSWCHHEGTPVRVTCELNPEAGPLRPGQDLEMNIFVTVEPGAVAAENTASLSEAGVPIASTGGDDVVGPEVAQFGPSAFLAEVDGEAGPADTQAGDHPYGFSTRIDMNTKMGVISHGERAPQEVSALRDAVVDLPLGFLGSAQSTPKCTFAQLQAYPAECPLDTVVGHVRSEPKGEIGVSHERLYNMVPERGVAAAFGFKDILHNTHEIVASLAPSTSGYVLRAMAHEITGITLTSIFTTVSGDPSARQEELASLEGIPPVIAPPAAMFTNPSDCSGAPQRTSLYVDSWEHPGAFNPDGTPNVEGEGWSSSSSDSPPVTGCDLLHFDPSAFSFQPETSTADSPTGATFDLQIPQSETPGTLATPPLRNATVTLPPGLTLDPSSAGGLQACSVAQIGWLGASGPHGEALPNRGLTNFTEAAPTCPEASKIGSVEVDTPLIEGTIKGSVYLAAESENPYGARFAGYVVIDDERTGTIVKIPGEIKANEETGQVTGVFDENPQFPFSELRIHFFGGEKGDLATPEACGTYTTNADLEPWSAPQSGPNATPSSSFAINNGCVSGFTPAFAAGTTSPQAGSFSPFTLSFGREDDEQALGGLTVNLPTGLVGRIAGVAECSDAAIAAAANTPGRTEQSSPSCPESSLVGTVTTLSGPGKLPYSVAGRAYLTGPYKGAPYGMAVIVPAVAGPFDLGTVVIRQALFINPTDAHVTDVSDPFPTIRDGIPLRIQRVNVNLNRPGFTLNPTSCETKSITGTATSTTGTQTPVSSHYQAAACASLPFHPEFSASTSGKTSRANGASFHVRIGFPTGGQANIHKVELTIPSVLPSRLTTLQKACPEAVFNSNPAGCPKESLIATAVAHTPLLPDPLVGPVYFVSHGGAAFPDTVMVLQGDNVKLEVTGHTDIKNSVTYSRFETVPDAPVTSFEFNAPEGPYSIFGAYGVLCQKEIKAPTTITAQNGAVFSQDTAVEVEGCPNKLTIISHGVKKRTITLKVAVPGAGKLTATGKHLTKASKTAGGRGILTLTLKATKGGKLNTKVKLTFAPTKGKHLSASVSAGFKR